MPEETAARFIELIISDEVDEARRLLELHPNLPNHSLTTALVCAETEFVREHLNDPTQKLPPNDWQPIEYVSYSRIHRFGPDKYRDQLECARMLLDAGADPNTSHPYEDGAPLSVLFAAAGDTGHLGLTRLLLERGANPMDGESVYHAAQHAWSDILEVLVEFGADISSTQSPHGNTPLYFLAGFRATDPDTPTVLKGVRWLLEHGADPNVLSYACQETPLHQACRSGNIEMAKLLLRHGVDPTIKNANGVTARMFALLTGDETLLSLLPKAANEDELVRSFDKTRFIPKLGELGNIAGLKQLLAEGADVNTKDSIGATALHYASFTGRAEVVRFLIDHGASAEIKDEQYAATPLGWAQYAMEMNRNPNGDYPAILSLLQA